MSRPRRNIGCVNRPTGKKIGEEYPRHEIMPGEMFSHMCGGRLRPVYEAVSHNNPAITIPSHMEGHRCLCIDNDNHLMWTDEDDMVIYCGKVRILPNGEKCTRGLMIPEEDRDE